MIQQKLGFIFFFYSLKSKRTCTNSTALFDLLTFQPVAFQRSATKPFTCAIMTSARLGGEFIFGTWNSARVWRGEASAKESATQVSCVLLPRINRVLFLPAIVGVMSETQHKRLRRPGGDRLN